MQVKILLKQGKHIRQISLLLKLSRNIVKRYLRAEGEPRYKSPLKRPSKLLPYYEYLQARSQGVHPQCFLGERLFTNVQASEAS